MRYFLKRTLRIARYLAGWRAAVVVVAFVLTALAIESDSGAPLYLAGAALVSLVLVGTIGARVNETHAELRRLRSQVRQAATDAPQVRVAEQTQPQPASVDTKPDTPIVTRARRPSASPFAQPDVTVVVTAFNEAEYILDCLDSIRRQTWQNFECVVVDDESTDDTLQIAFDRFSPDDRFRFVSIRSNSGLSAARNVGTEVARAPWITFVDGDDYLYIEALERRMATLASNATNHWIAGAYCSWAPVPQDEPLKPKGEDRAAKKRISWLDALHDAPFIASAPIVRTAVIRAMGGFRDVEAAEDADMWTKVLRHGFVFLPTRYTGIAYRQKANSMFRRETVEHATVTVGLYESNYEPKPPSEFVDGTPFHFTEPAPAYVLAAESFRRNLIALTTAVAQGDSAAIERFVGLIDIEHNPYLPWVVDVDQIILQAARRSESYDREAVATRAEILANRTSAILAPHLEPTEQLPGPPSLTASTAATAMPNPAWAPVRDRQRIHLPARELATAIEGHVVMTPSAAYHIDELGPLAEELGKLGLPVAFMVTDRRWDWTEAGLRAWDFPVYSFPEDTSWTKSIAAMVTLNDWGEEPHVAMVVANEFGVPTFAKVEGVQDFDDVDVPRTRNPYGTAKHVLCQGVNDENALSHRADTHIVGNSRLESIWNNPGRRPVDELAVVNLNFTWGVLEEARDMWVDTVLAALKELDIPAVFSLHPAENARPAGAAISDQPMRHLLTQATVLISRFSTVPFEAMARGVPFVYHNPHSEAVPTFKQPLDAYEITSTAADLAKAIETTRGWVGTYRSRSEAFFRNQIDIDPDIASATRSAATIARLIGQ